jgi:hypothetical protein
MNDLKTFNFRTEPDKNGRRATISGIQVGNTIRIGDAEWNPIYRLPFSRSKGRQLAFGKAIECPVCIIELEEGDNPIEKFNNYALAYTGTTVELPKESNLVIVTQD